MLRIKQRKCSKRDELRGHAHSPRVSVRKVGGTTGFAPHERFFQWHLVTTDLFLTCSITRETFLEALTVTEGTLKTNTILSRSLAEEALERPGP